MSRQPGASPQPGGRRRMVRWTLALYPRAWRARYGSEVASLSEELIAEGDSTPWRAGLDLITGAAVERGRALARSRRIAVVPAVAVLVAAAGTGWAVDRPHPARSRTQAASLASVRCLPGPPAAVRVHGPGPARSRSIVVIPAPPGWKPVRAHGPAGQVRLKTGQVRPKGIWCITRLPVPCSASLPRPPAGARALPGRLRWIRGGPPGQPRPVRPGTVPAPVRPAQAARPRPARPRSGGAWFLAGSWSRRAGASCCRPGARRRSPCRAAPSGPAACLAQAGPLACRWASRPPSARPPSARPPSARCPGLPGSRPPCAPSRPGWPEGGGQRGLWPMPPHMAARRAPSTSESWRQCWTGATPGSIRSSPAKKSVTCSRLR